MGGFGSGRNDGAPTAERLRSLMIDVNEVMRDYEPARGVQTRWVWADRTWLEIHVSAGLGGRAHARLVFAPDTPETLFARCQFVDMAWMRPRFGGRRWFFICPRAGRRCTRLILPEGGTEWASRKGYGLGYQSQRETDFDRALRRLRRLERKVAERNHPTNHRRRMHRRTFGALCDQIDRAEELIERTVARRLQQGCIR